MAKKITIESGLARPTELMATCDNCSHENQEHQFMGDGRMPCAVVECNCMDFVDDGWMSVCE